MSLDIAVVVGMSVLLLILYCHLLSDTHFSFLSDKHARQRHAARLSCEKNTYVVKGRERKFETASVKTRHFRQNQIQDRRLPHGVAAIVFLKTTSISQLQ